MGTKRIQLIGGAPVPVGNQTWPLPAASGSRPAGWLGTPPVRADGWDFDATLASTADLAELGWTVKFSGAPYTVLPRSGDVQAASAGVKPPAGTYWSTLIGGRLVLQFANASGVEIVRPSSGPYTYKFHVSPSNFADGASNLYGFVAQGNNFDQGGNQIAYVGRENTAYIGVVHIGPGTFNFAFSIGQPNTDLNVDRFLYIEDAGLGARNLVASFRYPNGVFWETALPGLPVGFTTSSAGVLLVARSGSPNFFYIDALRRLPFGSVM